MRNLRERWPVWVAVILTLLLPVISLVASAPLLAWDGIWNYGDYLPQLIMELLMLVMVVLLTLLLKMGHVVRTGRRGVKQWLLPMLPILLLYIYSTVAQWLMSCMGTPVQVWWKVVIYILCMLSIGVVEELLFRGLVTQIIFDKYGKSSAGVWLTVLVSSMLFGAAHGTNALTGEIPLSGVLVQVVAATSLGMCLAAVYLRSRNLWAVAFLHGFMDFCALFTTGVYSVSTVEQTVGGYDAAQLLASLVYTAYALILLRPVQMRKLLGVWREPEPHEIIKLMVAVLILSGVFTAMLVYYW